MIDFLRKMLGEALTEDMVKEIEVYLAENYVEKAEYEKLAAQANSTVQNTDKQMDGNMVAAGENVPAANTANLSEEQLLKIKAEVEAEIQAEYEERVYAIEFDYAVNVALLQIGVVDLDLVKVKLDMTKLSMNDQGEISGLEEQIEEIRQQFPMLFVDNADLLPANFYGLKPMVGQKNYSAVTREDINNMNYKERLALLKSNPSLYHALVG
ncbi:MAG: phage scaffolding protein [Bacillota bacterium]